MQFQILGPLEVQRDGRAVRLGGPKQRLVLAHLLLRPDAVVSADLLIDEIWGDAPPDAARPSLHSYISHLRQAVGGERLIGRPPGYILHVRPDEVDAARFERLVSQARRRLSSDPAAAARILRDALRLWRGEPFGDLAGELSLQAEIERLSAMRLAALEDRIEADLALGRHSELVPELERVVAEYPLRERFCIQLMLALYRAGRQADALSAYQRLRKALDEELGLDPSPAVEELQRRILVHDPALELPGRPLRGYRLMEQMGAGRHGLVHGALEPQTGREVAIKVLDARIANDADFVRQFDPAARRVAGLTHPHVLPLHDWWREPDAAYLVMRLIRGGSLADRLARELVTSVSALRWSEQIGAALTAAHRQAIVHGDIRPQNILLDADDNAYLSDFALGYDPANQAMSRSSAPDVRYLSPERRAGQPPSEASDIYAFGVLLGEMLSGSLAGNDGADLRLTLARATAASPGERQQSATDLAAAVRRGLLVPTSPSPVDAGAAHSSRNPYKGLRAFEEHDEADFFGREKLIERLLERMRAPGEAARLLAVVGPSGSGKSSVVNAGLLPALRAGALPGSAEWYVATMTPDDRPFEKLEAALLGVAIGVPVASSTALETGDGLRRAVERALPEDAQLLLVIDQFEELFTLVDEAEVRGRFLDFISETIDDPASRVRVVITLRADFYDRPLRHERFGRQLAARTQVVPPLTPEEIERVIAEPARRAGLRLEQGLVARIAADASAQPGGLPLLQYALSEQWERREGSRLTLRSYESSGGIAGAVARRADELFRRLDVDGQEVARQVFLRLVEPGEGAEDTARRVRRSELQALDERAGSIDQVMEGFARFRLLLFDRDPETREPTVEVSHEALLRAWPRLQQWVDEARDDLRQQRRLAAAASQWREAGYDASFLLSGTRLAHLEQWAQSTRVLLAPAEQDYLAASSAERDRVLALEQERRKHEAALERRAVTRLRALVAVLAVGALLAASLSVFAVAEGRRAEREATISSARELAAAAVANLDVDPELSVLLGLEAVDRTRTMDGSVLREAEEALRRATKQNRVVHTVREGNDRLAVSSDGTRFATTAGAGTVTIRDTASADELFVLDGHGEGPNAVAFSPGDDTIATAGADGGVRLWDARTGEPVNRFDAPGREFHHLKFSPDGTLLVADDTDGPPPLMLDVDTLSLVPAPGLEGLTDPAFSPDGSLVAGGMGATSTTAKIVELTTGRERILEGHAWGIYSVAFSADSRFLATASNDGTARIWDARSGAELATLYGHAGNVWAVAWSPDGTRVATGGSDGTARVWNARTGQHLLTLAGHSGALRDVAYTPDGDMLLTTGDNETRVWDVTVGGERDWLTVPAAYLIFVGVDFSPDGAYFAAPAEPSGVSIWDTQTGELVRSLHSESKLTSVDFSPDGRRLVAGSDLTFAPPVWDVASGELLFELTGHDDAVRAVAFSPDGQRVATGSWDGTVGVWDAANGERIATLEPPEGGPVVDVLFTPDGSMLAAGSDQGDVTLWDSATLRAERSIAAHRTEVNGIAFGPDGMMLTAGVDATAKVWRLDALETPIMTLHGHAGPISQGAFSPDGTLVATAGDDGLAKLWDVRTGQEKLTLQGHELVLYGVEFSPDGRLLATGSADGTIALHLLPIDEFVELARRRVTRDFTDAECRQYLHLDACSDPG